MHKKAADFGLSKCLITEQVGSEQAAKQERALAAIVKQIERSIATRNEDQRRDWLAQVSVWRSGFGSTQSPRMSP
jgi:hypothetical protein